MLIVVEGPAISRVERAGWRAAGIGAALALVASIFPLLRFISSYLTVLVHEMGHTLTAWLFAYPAIPAFDFRYGGGLTIQGERSWFLLLIPLGLLAWMGWRHAPRARWVWAAIALAFLGLALSPAHRHLMTIMGHGTELLIATIFLYRALSGAAIKLPTERPLYAACGSFIVFESLRFGWRLMTDKAALWEYEQAKGGGHWMDFSQLAGEFAIRVPVIAGVFFATAALTPVLAWLVFRYREFIAARAKDWLGAV